MYRDGDAIKYVESHDFELSVVLRRSSRGGGVPVAQRRHHAAAIQSAATATPLSPSMCHIQTLRMCFF